MKKKIKKYWKLICQREEIMTDSMNQLSSGAS